MLCRFSRALEALQDATDNKDRHYFTGLCHINLRQYDQAIESLERAKAKGWDSAAVDVRIVEVLALSGDLATAEKAMQKLASALGDSADAAYLNGLLAELTGRGEQALEAYAKARELQESHPQATFRLAYYLDLHGEEEEAKELYEECLCHPPIFANALLNMAVLHEDAGDYDKAMACLRRLLATYPDHPRARLFLRDAEASTYMFYDEDQARRIAKRNAVLDIPVTDFELSVRARNCLVKMDILTLGDLVRTSEQELLGYKNFGETSLKEIKEMLSAKGLRLGQALEEASDMMASSAEGAESHSVEQEGVLATPLSQIEFSIRARRVLEQLGVRTLGDLAAKTEAELIGMKNFGQTSLNEMRQRLADYGLAFGEAK